MLIGKTCLKVFKIPTVFAIFADNISICLFQLRCLLMVISRKLKLSINSMLEPAILSRRLRICFETIVSDNSPQFASKTFADWFNAHSIAHLTSAPFHPASTGEAERFVRVFKQAMKRAVREEKKLKHLALREFLQQYRVTPHCTTGRTPTELMLGHQMLQPRALCATATCAQSETSAKINIASQAEILNR